MKEINSKFQLLFSKNGYNFNQRVDPCILCKDEECRKKQLDKCQISVLVCCFSEGEIVNSYISGFANKNTGKKGLLREITYKQVRTCTDSCLNCHAYPCSYAQGFSPDGEYIEKIYNYLGEQIYENTTPIWE